MPPAQPCLDTLSLSPAGAQALLDQAKGLAAAGKNEQAFACYVAVLRSLPNHLPALHELGRLAYRCGHRKAARTTYEQLVSHHPLDTVGRVNFGTLLYEDGDLIQARLQFQAALALDGSLRDPHRGLARIAQDLGEDQTAQAHWRKSFSGQAVVTQPCRGPRQPDPFLMLVSTKGGNIPTQHILDDQIHAVSVLYAEYFRADLPLPSHGFIFNAIGDADRCGEALMKAQTIVAQSGKPVINHPVKVQQTARLNNAQRLAGLSDVRVPKMWQFHRSNTQALRNITYPILFRTPGYHTGQHFLKVDAQEDVQEALSLLPGEELLAIEFLDARGCDGQVRKYRVMYIDGTFYPLHLAISGDWKVHYFSADMDISDAHRAEEMRFLADMQDVVGRRGMNGLQQVATIMGLDYAGIDFALDSNGSVLLFEANATMLINPPASDPKWEYRRGPTARALAAARKLLDFNQGANVA